MADYHTPTVVTPTIPETEMTPLERLILGHAYEAESDNNGEIYFHAWSGPSSAILLNVGRLRKAYEQSKDAESRLNDRIATVIEKCKAGDACGDDDYLDVDLTGPEDLCDVVFQDIVRRSVTIDEIIVTAAWTCTKMRPDGFGGSVMRITAEAMEYRSTASMLEKLQNTPERGETTDTGGHETQGRFEAVAGEAGWDSHTLLLLIARWADNRDVTAGLIGFLETLAHDESE